MLVHVDDCWLVNISGVKESPMFADQTWVLIFFYRQARSFSRCEKFDPVKSRRGSIQKVYNFVRVGMKKGRKSDRN